MPWPTEETPGEVSISSVQNEKKVIFTWKLHESCILMHVLGFLFLRLKAFSWLGWPSLSLLSLVVVLLRCFLWFCSRMRPNLHLQWFLLLGAWMILCVYMLNLWSFMAEHDEIRWHFDFMLLNQQTNTTCVPSVKKSVRKTFYVFRCKFLTADTDVLWSYDPVIVWWSLCEGTGEDASIVLGWAMLLSRVEVLCFFQFW